MEATMTRLLTPTSILLTVILLAVNIPALAVDRTFQIEVENSLKGTVPSNWWLHASWRDQTLVVFVSPPTQESFGRYATAKGDLGKPLQGDPHRDLEPGPARPGHRLRAGCWRQWRQRQLSVLVPKISGQVDRLIASLDETLTQHLSDEGRRGDQSHTWRSCGSWRNNPPPIIVRI